MSLRKERAMILIKPDGVKRGLVGEILRRFERAGLKIAALKMIWATREQVEKHYPNSQEWLKGMGEKTLRNYAEYGIDPIKELETNDPLEIGAKIKEWNIDYLTSGPMVAVVVESVHAVDNVRKLVGNTLPVYAAPGTIRGDFSVTSAIQANAMRKAIKNIIHASGSLAESEHEIHHWFSSEEIYAYQRIEEELMFV